MIKIASSGGFFSPTDDPMHPHFAQDELDQIVRTAADLERPVMAHAHSPSPSSARCGPASGRSSTGRTSIRGRPR